MVQVSGLLFNLWLFPPCCISGYDGMMVMARADRILIFLYCGLLSMWINPFYGTLLHHSGIYYFLKSTFLDLSGHRVEASVWWEPIKAERTAKVVLCMTASWQLLEVKSNAKLSKSFKGMVDGVWRNDIRSQYAPGGAVLKVGHIVCSMEPGIFSYTL